MPAHPELGRDTFHHPRDILEHRACHTTAALTTRSETTDRMRVRMLQVTTQELLKASLNDKYLLFGAQNVITRIDQNLPFLVNP